MALILNDEIRHVEERRNEGDICIWEMWKKIPEETSDTLPSAKVHSPRTASKNRNKMWNMWHEICRWIDTVGHFTLCSEILLVINTVLSMPFYACVGISTLYSFMFEFLTAYLARRTRNRDFTGANELYKMILQELTRKQRRMREHWYLRIYL